MTTTIAKRIFKFNDKPLTDPGYHLSAQEVMEFYSDTYPELTTAKITGPVIDDENNMVWTFKKNVGTNG